MKKFLTMLSLVLLGFASTSCYDDSELWESVEDLDARVETLETLCAEMNANLTSLTELINAMTMGDAIIGVTPVKENGVEVGYQLLLKDGGIVTLYHGKNGKDGAAGADGKDGVNGTDGQDAEAPVFGVKEDTDGVYYWTLDGEFVVDAEGNKLPVTAAAPKVKVENETWMVSYDDGKTWTELGPAVTVGIKDVEYTDDVLILTMNDGTKINVKIGSGFKVVLGEFDATALQYGSDLEIPYTIEGAEGEVVVFLLREGEGFAVELVEESATKGKVVVSQLEATATEKNLKVGIFASGEDGTTVSKAVKLVSGVFATVDGNKETYVVTNNGGKVEFKVATNQKFEVKVEDGCDWISLVPQTKAVEEVTLVFNVAANTGDEERTATVELVSGNIKLSFAVTQAGGFIIPEETLVGAYKIQKFWVYGGTGPAYGGAGWVDLHNKTWWFDEGTGHGIKAETDNYLEFTLTDFNFDYTQSTGKCVNWAGKDGKNWDTWFYNNKKSDGTERNPQAPKDGSNFYRQIPIGESTWVRDYTVTPNTVTFTDAEGRKTVLELLEPGYEFTTDKYGDSNAAGNKRTFPRTEGDDLTFHAKLTGWKEVWPARYSELDKVFDCPREFFIDVDKVDEIPAESKTSEPKWVPELPKPETPAAPTTLAGTYKFRDGKTVGGKTLPDAEGKNGNITAKGLIEQYGGWGDPRPDGQKFSDVINKMKNDKYTFVVTGSANGNETGTVSFDDGGDGTWDYVVLDNKVSPYVAYDATDLYGIIAHDNTTTYVYDATAGTVTLTTNGKEYVLDFLVPGTYKYSSQNVTVPTQATFGLHLDLGYTEARVANYKYTDNGFARHYVWARHHVFMFDKE